MLAVEQMEMAVPKRAAQRIVLAAPAPLPVWQVALSWVLLVPILYVAANGTFIPSTGEGDVSPTGQSPGHSASHKITLALVNLLCLALMAFRFSSVLALSRRMKIALALPMLAILSCTWSADPLQSVVSGTLLLIFTLFAIYVADRFSFQRQIGLIMMVGAIALPLSIALALFLPSMGSSQAGWRGIFGHKQGCAAAAMFWLITALHWQSSGFYQKMGRAMCIVMSVVLVVMSRSRTGWALALVALVLSGVIWLLQKFPAKQAITITLFGLPAVAAALVVARIYFPFLLNFVGKDTTLSQRTIIWAASWDAAMMRPFLGYGFAAFWKGLYGPSHGVVLIAGWGLQQAQDGFLDVWLGIGLLGVALVAAMAIQSLRNAISSFYSEGNQAYVRWCIVVIVCTLLYNIGESSIGTINIIWFLFLLAATGVNQVARERV
jgi:exopolysaccharide production protein ExoQ